MFVTSTFIRKKSPYANTLLSLEDCKYNHDTHLELSFIKVTNCSMQSASKIKLPLPGLATTYDYSNFAKLLKWKIVVLLTLNTV